MDKSAHFDLLKSSLEKLLQINNTTELFNIIGNDLAICVPDSIIITNEVTQNEEITTTRGIFGIKQPFINDLFKILGKNPVGAKFKLRDDLRKRYENGGIHNIEEGLTTFSNYYYSGKILDKIEKLLNIKKIYTSALKQKGKLIGVIHIFKQHESELANQDLIMHLLNQTELVLQNKLYQIELEKREEVLQNALATSSNGYWEWDFKKNQAKYSHQFAQMLGYQDTEFGTDISNWKALIYNGDKRALLNKINHYTKRGLPFSFEYRIKFKDGNYRWIESTGKSYKYDKQKNPKSVIIVNRNIHPDKLAEQALIKTKNRYQNLVNLTFEGIILHQNGICLDVNPAFLSITGYAKNDIIGKNLIEVLFKDDNQLQVKEAFKNFRNNKLQTSAVHKNGQKFFVEIEHKKLYNDPNKLSVFALRDMTTLKQTQAQLEMKNNELQKALRTKEKFLSIIAHDLKNPFTSIIGLLELMATRIHTQSKEKQLNFINQLLKESKNTYILLENLLNWSKVEQNKMPFSPEKLNLNDKCRQAMLSYLQIAESKNISIKNDIPEDLMVIADPQMLQSIIRNLISNAIKYTNNKGIIKLTAERVSKEKVQITISDNGIGLKPETWYKIQNNNNINSSPGTNKEEGTGLGLSIVQEFIHKHNSNVQINSKPGEGTAISFQLSVPAH